MSQCTCWKMARYPQPSCHISGMYIQYHFLGHITAAECTHRLDFALVVSWSTTFENIIFKQLYDWTK